MPTPEAIDPAVASNAAIIQYMREHFDKMRLHAGQIENPDLEDLYARCTDVLEKMSPPD